MTLLSSHLPARLAAGAFIFHSGWDKLHGSPELAVGVHGMATGTYPMLAKVPPEKFLKGLAVSELALGAALMIPFVPNRVVGVSLAGFAASLLGLYFRTPGMRKPGSVWPTQDGTGISKDVWLLGMGLSLAATK
jgi:uncharacterized membrane protein YphA (DoxX/SURF4 family)